MSKIALLSQDTIDKIAAGEVIERPASVVKELVENAIDAKATAITVEIKDGGSALIRISDNGFGIAKEDVPLAFLRHSTSKIKRVEDLLCVSSLGFRGEALSSIAAVSRVEVITKTPEALTGVRYRIEGSKEVELEEIGAPDGTTFLVKDIFYNTPARRKFLKSAQTESTHIADMVEKLALSHPDISFKYIQNNKTKLHTSGNGNSKDLIYHVFGREIASSLIPVDIQNDYFSVKGYIGKPIITRGNRNCEIYFINGRYIKSALLSKSIEEAYKSFLMQHKYPFCVLYFTFEGTILDVNVHPTKMELRFDHNVEIYQLLSEGLYRILSGKELIPEVTIAEQTQSYPRTYTEHIPEPFEQRRLNEIREAIAKDSPYEPKYPTRTRISNTKTTSTKCSDFLQKENSEKQEQMFVSCLNGSQKTAASAYTLEQKTTIPIADSIQSMLEKEHTNFPTNTLQVYEQIQLASLDSDFLTKKAKKEHRVIGQLFKTYWLVEFEQKLFIVDQHAAHEKVLYERTIATLKEREFTSQAISPPILLTLDANEILMLETYRAQIEKMGYEVQNFGGKEYMIQAIPANLFHIDMKELFIEMLDDFANLNGKATPEVILEKVASMSCKAAVKGNQNLTLQEFDTLMEELLTLENPYHCPHGRPTIISMSKYEIEKKFKRII
ncbi:MAG: DNA mismatch repair endonuclease MutL [Lachnospiraceae bacterium]|nr:DNA mismatch repair endonuclease MutL [Lachnospiraceae bacterium]